MTLADLTQQAGEWLRGVGPMHDVVISSRVRLARNVAGMPFLARCHDQQLREMIERVRREVFDAHVAKDLFFVDMETACQQDRELLSERHLISGQHVTADHPRGVIISGDETLSIMINEEDHLRMQVLRSGLQLNDAFKAINDIDDRLEEQMDFAYSSQFGYLTACPTNVGTGLRISVMLHLPALKFTGEIEKTCRAAHDLRLATRGLYGEGSDATGDFFQLSNQVTLGRSESELVEEFLTSVVPMYIEYERRARKGLLRNSKVALEDRIFRSLALLRSSRRISAEETMYHLSLLRLGINLEITHEVDLKTVNELFLLCQPAHLQKIHNQEMDSPRRAEVRAQVLRQRIG